MATNEELEKMIQILQQQLNSLQDGLEKYQQLLTQEVETKQLKASESAQIATRDIGTTIDTIEQRLNAHDTSLNAHEGRLNTYDSTLNVHEQRLNTHDSSLNTHEQRLNLEKIRVDDIANRTQTITFDGVRTLIDAGNKLFSINNDGNLVVFLKHDGKVLWDSGTWHDDSWNGEFLRKFGDLANRIQKITCDGAQTYIDGGDKTFVIQNDGNLVVYRKVTNEPLWNSGTAG